MRETRSILALSGVTTGTSNAYSLADMDTVGIDCDWASGVTTGIVALERAPTIDYAGTWKSLVVTDASAVSPAATDGDALDVLGGFVRARVTTTVSGGGSPSVTVRINMRRRA